MMTTHFKSCTLVLEVDMKRIIIILILILLTYFIMDGKSIPPSNETKPQLIEIYHIHDNPDTETRELIVTNLE